MSEINNNSQYNYNISLDPPNTSAQGTKEGEVEATRKGEVTITDKLTGATMVLSATFDKLGKMTIYMDSENPNLPTPAITSLQINSALKPGDSTGRGNPFLSPIPFVQVTVALLKLHSIMRESNLGMAAFENSVMALSMSLARTEADLIISAADKEAKMMIMEMVSAGMAIVGAAVTLGGGIRGLYKAAKLNKSKAKTDLDTAKKNAEQPLESIASAKADLKTKQESIKKLDAADQELTNATASRETSLKNKKTAEKDLNTTSESQSKQVIADHDLEVANKRVEKAKADLEGVKKDLGFDTPVAGTGSKEVSPQQRLKNEIAAQEKAIAKAEGEAKHLTDDVKVKQDEFNAAQQEFSAKSQNETMVFNALTQIFTQSGNMIKHGVNSVLVGQKAEDEADIKMTSAQREILNRTMDSLDKSMQKGGDVMNSLIQALEKLANDHVNASSMTRN